MPAKYPKSLLDAARKIQVFIDDAITPPQELVTPISESVLPYSIFLNSNSYIRKVVNQINATYDAMCFDACAVMIRRLLEILIVEVYESKGLATLITDSKGDYFFLAELVMQLISNKSWHLGRTTKNRLPIIKGIGDLSAHSRRFTAQRSDIDRIKDDLRVISEELLYLSNLR